MSKWIIVATLPEGDRFAFSRYNGSFALVPFDEHEKVKNALAWDSKEDAELHLEKQLEAAPELRRLGTIRVQKAWEPS
jgi:hypothetical protein